MCILLATKSHPDYPLIILSNRDEYFKRQTLKAHVRELGNGRHIVSPMDTSRKEHGTWIGAADDGRIAVLLNYREHESIFTTSQLSRGILPTSFLTSSESDEEWTTSVRSNHNDDFKKIGGFTLVYGQFSGQENRPINILSNRDEHRKVFQDSHPEGDSGHETTIGISNSLFSNPWKKIDLGISFLDSLVAESTRKKYNQQQLVDKCFDILSHNTYDPKIALESSHHDQLAELQNSIFIPPLETARTTATDPKGKNFYGTRTQTIILVDRSSTLHYYERDLDCSNDAESPREWTTQHFDFKIEA